MFHAISLRRVKIFLSQNKSISGSGSIRSPKLTVGGGGIREGDKKSFKYALGY